MKIENVEVLAVGTWNRTAFTASDLDTIVRSFDELNLSGKLPVKLGHMASDTEPAQGWVTALRREGDKLLATFDQVPDELVQEIKQGRWRHVSVELLKNVARGDKRYGWVLDGVAVLGAARPAVDVLQGLHEIVCSALPGLRFGSRVSLSRENQLEELCMNEVERLKLENERLTAALVSEKFESAIQCGRIDPSERYRFSTKYGASATVRDAENWISSAPKPKQTANRSTITQDGGGVDVTGLPSDQAMVLLTRERQKTHFKETGEKISLVDASLLVCKDPAYRDIVKDYGECGYLNEK